MHFCYIDDSGDDKMRVFSAIAVPSHEWRNCFSLVRDFRRDLKHQFGIYVTVEFHATEFVGGRGKIAAKDIFKGTRCRLFKETLERITGLPGVKIFNAAAPKVFEARIYERLLNRINRTMKEWDSHAIIVSDEGKDYTGLLRKMGVHNHIPSRFGAWPTGAKSQNITVEYILEDIFFRNSARSYFIQMADFCAYALLRSENPIPSKTKYGLDKAFDCLAPVCTPECFSKDHRKLGIVREI
jgi:Protein of unknown function (DUF3800)